MAIRKSATRMKSLWASRADQSDQRLVSIDADPFDQTGVAGSFEFETDIDVRISREESHAESNERSSERSMDETQDRFQDACVDGGQNEWISEIQIGDPRVDLCVDSGESAQRDPRKNPEISENEQIEQTEERVEGRDQKCVQRSRRLGRLGHRDRHRDITTAIRKALTRCDEGSYQSGCLDVMDTSQSHTSQFPGSQFPVSQLPASQFIACLRESLTAETGQKHSEAAGVSTGDATRVQRSQHLELCDIRSNATSNATSHATSHARESHILVQTGLAIDDLCGGLVCGALHELRDVASQAAVAFEADLHRSNARIVPFGIIAHLACCALVTPEIGGHGSSSGGEDQASMRIREKDRRIRNVSTSDNLVAEHAFVVWVGDRVRPSDALFQAFASYRVLRRPERTKGDTQTDDRDHTWIEKQDGSACMHVHDRSGRSFEQYGVPCRSLASCSIFIGDADERGTCACFRNAPPSQESPSQGSPSQESLRRSIGGKLVAPELRVWSAEHFLKSGSPGVLVIDGDNFNTVCWRRLQLAASQASAPVLVLVVTSGSVSTSWNASAKRGLPRDTPTSRAVATRWDVRASAEVHTKIPASIKRHTGFRHSVLQSTQCVASVPGFEWTMTLRVLRGRAALAMTNSSKFDSKLNALTRVRDATENPVLTDERFKELLESDRRQYEKLSSFCRVSAIADGSVRGSVARPRAAFGEDAWALVSAKAAARRGLKRQGSANQGSANQGPQSRVDREKIPQTNQHDAEQNVARRNCETSSVLLAEMYALQHECNRSPSYETAIEAACLDDVSMADVHESRQGCAA